MPRTRPALNTLLAVAMLSLSTACSPSPAEGRKSDKDRPEEGYQRPKVWPKPVDPPPPSPIYHDLPGKVPTEEEIARDAAEHNAALEAGIEGALETTDLATRETAFVFLLPELLQVEPERVVALHARLKPGEARETLLAEIAQLWASTDAAAAARWMKTLDETERRAAATTAVTTLASWDAGSALALAGQLELDRDERLRNLLAPLRAEREPTQVD